MGCCGTCQLLDKETPQEPTLMHIEAGVDEGEKMQENVIQTHCRFCEFRVNDEQGNQVGCEVDALSRLEANGAEIFNYEIEVDDGHVMGNYLVIDHRICPYRRPPGWKEAKRKNDANKDKTFEQIAFDELKVKPDVVVFLAPGHTVDDLVKTARSVNEQTEPVNRIIFINFAGINPIEFSRIKPELKTPYVMEYMVEPPKKNQKGEFDYAKTKERAVDYASKKIKVSHFTVWDAGHQLPKDYVEKMNITLFKNLERMVLLLPDEEGQGLLTSLYVFKSLSGNVDENYVDKVTKLSERQECPQLIKNQS